MVTRVVNLTIRSRTVQSLQHKYNELKAIKIKKEKEESTANLIRWTQTANTIVEHTSYSHMYRSCTVLTQQHH